MSTSKDLFIYEISGNAPHPKTIFQQDFLGCWYNGSCSYLFFSSNRRKEIDEYLTRYSYLSVRSETVIGYKDWETGKEFNPFRVGKLLVYPAWETIEKAAGEIAIAIDPCLAFGTGNHDTTRQCLESLCLIYGEDKPGRVLDLGCGTGILAIAAAKLGAEKVLAVDYSNLAVEATERNIAINDLNEKVTVTEGEALDYLSWEADLIAANLLYPVLEELMKSPHFPGKRWYVLSGLLRSEENKVREQLVRLGTDMYRIFGNGVWTTVVGKTSDLMERSIE